MPTEPVNLTDPLPFFHHAPSGRVLYIAPGPCPVIFSISLKDVARRAPVASHGPDLHPTTHPFGLLTAAASLAASVVRRELCDAEPLAAGALDETLSLWANFCDDVVGRLNDGEPLAEALDDAWVLGDGDDVDVDDEPDEVSCTAPRSDGDIHGDLCADT